MGILGGRLYFEEGHPEVFPVETDTIIIVNLFWMALTLVGQQ